MRPDSNRLLLPIVLWLAAGLFFPPVSNGQQPNNFETPKAEKTESDWLSSGTIFDICKAGSFVKLSVDGPRLKSESPVDYREAQQSFSEVRQITRGSGSSSTHGRDRWSISSIGKIYSCELENGPLLVPGAPANDQEPSPEAGLFRFSVNELEDPFRSILITTNSKGRVSFHIRCPDGSRYFAFRQRENGEVHVLHVDGQNKSVFTGNDFDQLYRKHPEFVDSSLLPLFDRLGLGRPITRYGVEMQLLAIESLAGVNRELMTQFKIACEGLNARNFADRENAMNEISGDFKHWEPAIRAVLETPQFSPETQRRLFKIYELRSDNSKKTLIRMMRDLDLLNDPEYLVRLLNALDEPDPMFSSDQVAQARSRIASKLTRITGQDHGISAQKWNAWIANSGGAGSGPPNTTPDQAGLLKAFSETGGEGPIVKVAELTKELLPFAVRKEQIIIDRARWQKRFPVENLEQSVDEISQLMEQRGIPRAWFLPGGSYSLKTTGPPQLLFEHISNQVHESQGTYPRQQYGMSVVTFSRNRNFITPLLIGHLNVHPSTEDVRVVRNRVNQPNAIDGTRIPQEQYFHFELREKQHPFQHLQALERPGKSLSVSSAWDGADRWIELTQDYGSEPAGSGRLQSGRLQLTIVHGSQIQQVVADSVTQLLEDHEPLVSQVLGAGLGSQGIVVEMDVE